MEERVEVFIPKGGAREEPNVFVGINGVNYLLPKGQTSLVPPEVAEELERARKAQQRQDKNIDQMLGK